eukprot:767146-Hanusia_phi.AAC.5
MARKQTDSTDFYRTSCMMVDSTDFYRTSCMMVSDCLDMLAQQNSCCLSISVARGSHYPLGVFQISILPMIDGCVLRKFILKKFFFFKG